MTPTRLTAARIVAPGVPEERQDEYRRLGYVSDMTMSSSVERAARLWGSRPAVTEAGVQMTHRELLGLVERAAAWLSGAGIRPGDVVCWQTPNWWEAHLLGLAVWHVGAVSAPIAPFYREHELRQVIEEVRPAAVISAESFRGFAHAEAFDDLLAETDLDGIPRILLRGSRCGWTPFDDVVWHDRRLPSANIGADEPCLVLFTSGTTSRAKAAVHSSRTLLAETRQLADAWGLGWEDVAYMAAPLQHITGLLNAMTIPLLVGACAVLAERWEPGEAVRDMMAHQVTYSAGATVFLQELTDAARDARIRLPLRMFACGGASVPRSVMERSEEQGIPAARVYGMTELPTVTVMNRADPFDLRATTDGAVAPGVEVRALGDDCQPLPTGFAGELAVRGPERMLGYLDPAANRSALDDAGWFRTGDVGILGADGFLTITGRIKDVINRGGEKFSARDIEDLLASHPSVRQAAVVPGPDARFGEVPVAFVVLNGGWQSSVGELAAHLHTAGLARQKSPTAWHFVDALPMTPSGKVKKFELAATAAAAGGLTMNADQFRAMLDLGRDGDGRMILPVAHGDAERIFGGQMLAQLVAAVEPERTVKSLHVAFPREGRPHDPLYLDLENTHDGRTLGVRRAVVYQDTQHVGERRVVATGTILVDRADDGYNYQFNAVDQADPLAAKLINFPVVPGETRLISETGLNDANAVPAELAFWIRCADFTDTSLARPVLAYVSDWPLIGTLLKSVPGISQRDAHVRLQTGVVSHSVWFHQPFDVSDWLRIEIRGERLAGGRGFGTGTVYTQGGSLVASFAQESVIRPFA